MSQSSATHPQVPAGRSAWIDIVIGALGAGALLLHWWPLGVALVGLAGVMPLVRLVAARRDPIASTLALVPIEVAEMHAEVTRDRDLGEAAAGLRTQADEIVREVAAVLAGRPPRTRAQTRYVVAQLARLDVLVREAGERHAALADARRELSDLAPGALVPEPLVEVRAAKEPRDPLATTMLVVMAPMFLAWDLAGGTVQAVRLLGDGLLLRVQTIARLAGHLTVRCAQSIATAARRWRGARDQLVASAAEARHRFVAARLRLRLELRRR